MRDTWEEKIGYLDKIVRPELELAFRRGDTKYKDLEKHPRIQEKHPADDIRHMRECHVGVRLREAEDLADLCDIEKSLNKIESAIGYLILLHRRVRSKRTQYEEPK